MEELSSDVYCQRAALELAALISHQRRPKGRSRRDSALLRRCVEEVLTSVEGMERLLGGPWQIGQKPLRKPGRGGLMYIPFVKRGDTMVMVDSPHEAESLTAFLNYCGMSEFARK